MKKKVKTELDLVVELIMKSKVPITARKLHQKVNSKIELSIFCRMLRQKIHNLRLRGHPIGSSQKGYFLVEDKDVLWELYESFLKTYKSYGKLVYSFKKMLKDFEPKLPL